MTRRTISSVVVGLRPRDIHRDVGGVGGEGRRVGARRIADVHEVLGVGAVADDARAQALAHAVVRLDDVERVGGPVVLALAVDGGIAHHHVVEPALEEGVAAELLADDLAGAVDDRPWRRAVGQERRGLDEIALQAGPVAVDRAGGGEHELLHAGDAAGLDHVLQCRGC